MGTKQITGFEAAYTIPSGTGGQWTGKKQDNTLYSCCVGASITWGVLNPFTCPDETLSSRKLLINVERKTVSSHTPSPGLQLFILHPQPLPRTFPWGFEARNTAGLDSSLGYVQHFSFLRFHPNSPGALSRWCCGVSFVSCLVNLLSWLMLNVWQECGRLVINIITRDKGSERN